MSSPRKSPVKKVAKKAAPKKPAAHPPTSEMVKAAIAGLKERKGSSLAAIKKYIAANYKVDVEKLAPFIRRFIKKAVADGKLVQKTGVGCSGSFRLAAEPKKVAKKPKVAKKLAAKKAKKPAAKKATKKPAAKKATKKPAAKKATKKPAAKKPAAKKPAAKKPAKKVAKKPAKKAAKK